MISYNNFQNFLIQHILYPCKIEAQGFHIKYSTQISDFRHQLTSYIHNNYFNLPLGRCIFWFEEPFNENYSFENLPFIYESSIQLYKNKYNGLPLPNSWTGATVIRDYPTNFESMGMCNTNGNPEIHVQILATSEKSNTLNNWCRKNNFLKWYFFFHGFQSLNYFNDFKFIDQYYLLEIDQFVFEKTFCCLNHLLYKSRNYRLLLLTKMYSNNLTSHGFISATTLDHSKIKQDLLDPNSNLSLNAKKEIYNTWGKKALPLLLDKVDYDIASADISIYAYKSLWYLVTETLFFEDKLHLTEKIFKPIVIKKPFILCSTIGSLDYLRSYGFKTFDRWIDEGYDKESDPEKRLEMIIVELKKLCSMSKYDLTQMYKEMLPILEHNFNHFYNGFKVQIVDELLNNFEICLKQYNVGRYTDRFMYSENLFDKNIVREILLS